MPRRRVGTLELLVPSCVAVLSVAASAGLNVSTDPSSGEFEIRVDGEVWLSGGGGDGIEISADGMAGGEGSAVLPLARLYRSSGADNVGNFTAVTMDWGDDSPPTLTTTIRLYQAIELVVFTQSWPRGWDRATAPLPLPPPPPPHALPSPKPVPAKPVVAIAAFPAFNISQPVNPDLSWLGWAGCQNAFPGSGSWGRSGETAPHYDGVTGGVPLVLHDSAARTLVLSPLEHFFVAGQGYTANGSLECGIRGSVGSLPSNFSHSTVLVAGQGINATMSKWGDVLLSMSGKSRTDPCDDFTLGHLGYWTDGGSYYYHNKGEYASEQAALLATKADYRKRDIPVRYYQWDDWWTTDSAGDIPGIRNWNPDPTVFPSGMTDWLGEPLAMYAPAYSADNNWTQYEWRTDYKAKTALPVDPRFYTDLFGNVSAAGLTMTMFEQDWFQYLNTDTNLTNGDTTTGDLWTAQMDAAAAEFNMSVQFCMMNPIHTLQSTRLKQMTNGRATWDNHREYNGVFTMGQNSLLYNSLGFFASRDNVYSSNNSINQTGCIDGGEACVQHNAVLNNAVAVLSNGPYGISDKVGFTDRRVPTPPNLNSLGILYCFDC